MLMCFLSTSAFSQTNTFESFVKRIEEDNSLNPTLIKDFVKISEVEELKDLSSLELVDFVGSEKYFGFMFSYKNEADCQQGYFVTLDRGGQMIDFAETLSSCEIDLEATQYLNKEGSLRESIIEIMIEEEVVIDLSDTSNTLDNADTDLFVYFQYFEVQSDGFLLELTSPKKYIDEREYSFASMELMDEESLSVYNRRELQDIKNEILASYGHLFESKKTQEYFEGLEWYTPVGDATEKLTDVETRNVALINALILK